MKKPYFTIVFIISLMFLGISACSSTGRGSKQPPVSDVMARAEDAFNGKKYEKARELLNEVKARDAERKYFARAQIMIADSYFAEGSYPEAVQEYKAFLELHTYHEKAPYAQYGLSRSYFNQVDSVDRGFENIRAARREFKKLLERYPRNPYREPALAKLARCRNMLAEYENYVGSFYYKKEAYEAAVGRFEGLLSDYPGSSVEIDTLFKLGRAYRELGDVEKARKALTRLISEYPSSRQARGARELLKSP